MMKKVLTLLLTLCMVLSLAACGGKDAGNDAGSSNNDTSAPADTGSDDASGDAAPSGDTIKIGLYATITGPNALAGEMAEKGARLAIKEVNEAGGVNGQMLELVVYDDKSTPEGAVRAVTRMVDVDQVAAMVGSNSSPNIVAASQITEDAGVLQIGCGTSPSYTNAGYQYIFRGTANANLPNAAFVDAMTQMGVTKVAILSIASENGVSGVRSSAMRFISPPTPTSPASSQWSSPRAPRASSSTAPPATPPWPSSSCAATATPVTSMVPRPWACPTSSTWAARPLRT